MFYLETVKFNEAKRDPRSEIKCSLFGLSLKQVQ